MAQPRVSVLVPVLNGAAFIDMTVTSIFSQTIFDIEVIVIDDGSDDDTAERVRARAEAEPRLRLIVSARNVGPGAARNLGLLDARGDWIAILDADDRMEPDRLERLVAEAERNDLDAIADNLAQVDPVTGQDMGYAFPMTPDMAIDLSPERFLRNLRPGARVNLGWMQPVVSRAFLQRNGINWPDLHHAEDMVYTMRLLLAGARFRLLGWAGYRYTLRQSTTGAVSRFTRAKRSIGDQHRAIDLVLEACDPASEQMLEPRLRQMRAEIVVTSRALDLMASVTRKDWVNVPRGVIGVVSSPLALWRTLWARYFVGHRLS